MRFKLNKFGHVQWDQALYSEVPGGQAGRGQGWSPVQGEGVRTGALHVDPLL